MGFNSSWIRVVIIATLTSIVCNRIQEFEEILKNEDVWTYFGCLSWILGLFVWSFVCFEE